MMAIAAGAGQQSRMVFRWRGERRIINTVRRSMNMLRIFSPMLVTVFRRPTG